MLLVPWAVNARHRVSNTLSAPPNDKMRSVLGLLPPFYRGRKLRQRDSIAGHTAMKWWSVQSPALHLKQGQEDQPLPNQSRRKTSAGKSRGD